MPISSGWRSWAASLSVPFFYWKSPWREQDHFIFPKRGLPWEATWKISFLLYAVYPKQVTWETLRRMHLQSCLVKHCGIKFTAPPLQLPEHLLCFCTARWARVCRRFASHNIIRDFTGRLAGSGSFHTSLEPWAVSLWTSDRVFPIPQSSLLTERGTSWLLWVLTKAPGREIPHLSVPWSALLQIHPFALAVTLNCIILKI